MTVKDILEAKAPIYVVVNWNYSDTVLVSAHSDKDEAAKAADSWRDEYEPNARARVEAWDGKEWTVIHQGKQ